MTDQGKPPVPGEYPVDYTRDEALHPFKYDGTVAGLCQGCGEHWSWHADERERRGTIIRTRNRPKPPIPSDPSTWAAFDKMMAEVKFAPMRPEAMDEKSIVVRGECLTPREFMRRYHKED